MNQVRRLFALFLLPGLFFLTLGCAHPQARLQKEEEPEPDRYQAQTIGDVSTFANAEPIQVGGVGLVVGLEGTGGDPPPSAYRTMLENYLKQQRVEHIKELLASPNTSLVLISGFIPAGAHKGDAIDLEVTLPPNSRTTSLRGGYLKEAVLYNYEYAANLAAPTSPYRNSASALQGHPLAKAQGPVVVGLGDGDPSANAKRGRIWGGGKCDLDRPFYLVLNPDHQYARVASLAAERINETFHSGFRAPLGGEIAQAKTKSVIVLNVPPQYKHNLPRYLRVVRLIPLREKADKLHDNKLNSTAGAAPASAWSARSAYRRKLEEDLLDSAHTVSAALRLEALGKESAAVLKQGLASEHALVRFTSAEALAYLGDPAAGKVLAEMVEEQPALQAYSLTALASLDEGICHIKLRQLLASPSPETRYGAFRALRALDERDPAIEGELLNGSFWLHRAAPDTPSLIHLSISRRAEVVLFGEDVYLVGPFSFLAGEFTLTAGPNDEHCTISRISLSHGPSRKQCSLQVEEVLRTLAKMGGTYAEVVELLRQAGTCQCLTCRVEVDALPQSISVYQLAKAGKISKDKEARKDATAGDDNLLKTDEEVLNARLEFGATPTLFELSAAGRRPRSAVLKDEEAALRDRKPKDDKKTAERKAKSPE